MYTIYSTTSSYKYNLQRKIILSYRGERKNIAIIAGEHLKNSNLGGEKLEIKKSYAYSKLSYNSKY